MALDRKQWALAAVALVAACAVPWLWLKATRDLHSPPTRTWDATLDEMEKDPVVLHAFLSERAETRDGQWDYHWMALPAQHLWATLRFELGRMAPSPSNPTMEEVVEAYRVIGVAEVADRLARVAGSATAAATARDQLLATFKPRIAAARRGYMQEHRAQLDIR